MDFQYKHNWLVHETSEQWEGSISGLARQEPRAICTGCMRRARGKSMVGRRRREKREAVTVRAGAHRLASLGLQIYINIYIYIFFFSVSNAQNTIFIPSCPVPRVVRLRQIPAGVPTVADLPSADTPPSLANDPARYTRTPSTHTNSNTCNHFSLHSPFLSLLLCRRTRTHTHTHTHSHSHALTTPQLFTPVSLNAGLC